MFPLNILRRDDIIHVGNEVVMDDILIKASEKVRSEIREHVVKNPYLEGVESYVNMVVSDQYLGCPEIKWEQKEFLLLDNKVQVKIPIKGRGEIFGLLPGTNGVPNQKPGGWIDEGFLVNAWEIIGWYSSEKVAEKEILAMFNAWSRRMARFVTALQDKYQSWEKDIVQEGISIMHEERDKQQKKMEQRRIVESAIRHLNDLP